MAKRRIPDEAAVELGSAPGGCPDGVPSTFAYVDEFGTPSIDTFKDGVTNLFICAAVLVKPDDVAKVTDHINRISTIHFAGKEIRSSNIRARSRTQRRLKILRDLGQIPFSYYALVVDKRHVFRNSGLAYKQSFYKFFHRLLCKRLTDSCMDISIVADRLGNAGFMAGFKEYIEQRIGPSLFSKFDFRFGDWREEPLLQLADIVAGTLGKIYDPDHQEADSEEFRQVLAPKKIADLHWPPYWRRDVELEDILELDGNQWDDIIARNCLARLRSFMDGDPGGDVEVLTMQRIVLERLLQQRLLADASEQSIHKGALIHLLHEHGFREMREQKFQSCIVGGLRDQGFILAGTTAGYRLAMTCADICDYLNHNKTVIAPMLSRLKIAREVIATVTHNELDILADSEYQRLGSLVRAIEKSEVR